MLPTIHFSIGVLTVPSTDDKSKAQVYEGQFEEGKMTGIGTLRYGLQTNKQPNTWVRFKVWFINKQTNQTNNELASFMLVNIALNGKWSDMSNVQ